MSKLDSTAAAVRACVRVGMIGSRNPGHSARIGGVDADVLVAFGLLGRTTIEFASITLHTHTPKCARLLYDSDGT